MIIDKDTAIQRIIYLIKKDEELKPRFKSSQFIGSLLNMDRKTVKSKYEFYKFSADLFDLKAPHTNLERMEIIDSNFANTLKTMFNFGEINLQTQRAISYEFIFMMDMIRKNLLKKKEDCIKY